MFRRRNTIGYAGLTWFRQATQGPKVLKLMVNEYPRMRNHVTYAGIWSKQGT